MDHELALAREELIELLTRYGIINGNSGQVMQLVNLSFLIASIIINHPIVVSVSALLILMIILY